ncbi:PKD-like family lipoprotein [Sanguibacteroides justesenii]|uniref:Lipoprotein n=1 Tax=Sanguibacteroides justesenii TaxID=1547597 RepID=A0AB34R707_9PORP|nr:PKD-like family lipoprotein [Sanguibacteroides justesenii]KIO43243.1 hypothetical protein IE90_13650 [Sanguibacteroides justesenii]
MRKIVLGIGICCLLYGCYKDKGNDDYVPVNEIVIRGISALYQKNAGEILEIKPEVYYSYDTMAPKHWAYRWKIQRGKIIGNQQDLRYLADTIGEFECYFSVKDSVNGIEYVKEFMLRVTFRYNKGWMILSEKDQISHLSFIQERSRGKGTEYTAYPDVYEVENGDVLGSSPVKLREHWPGSDYSEAAGEVMVMQRGGQGCVELNDVSFRKVMHTRDEFLEKNYPPGFVIKDALHGIWSGYLLSEDGGLYFRKYLTNEILHSGAFMQFRAAYGGEELQVDRLVLTDYQKVPFFLLYDERHRRFLWISDAEKDATRIEKLYYREERPAAFMDITGLPSGVDLSYIGYLSEEYKSCGFLVLLRRNDEVIVQTFSVTLDREIINPYAVKFKHPDLLDGRNVMTLLPKRGYLLFSGGMDQRGLYCYDPVSNDIRQVYLFDSPVCSIAYNSDVTDRTNTRIGVGLENGTFMVLDASSDSIMTGLVPLYTSATSFGRIVDVVYKMQLKSAL